MKAIQLFILEHCPHCQKARKIIAELLVEQPEFNRVKVQMIDEEKEEKFANSFDYYYVPCFYVDGLKVYEGAVDKEVVRRVFEQALV
ncbi:MAG: thioredoxin family protein [Negativicutes bacterium]